MAGVSVLIPAYNEAGNIEITIGSLQEVPGIEEIIVVDDGSDDGTSDRASKAGAFVLSLPCNRGKGEALNYGARFIKGDFVLLIDADTTKTAREAERLLRPVIEGRADMTIAVFPGTNSSQGGFGLVKKIARKGLLYYTGMDFKEPLSGQRALTREALKGVLPLDSGFGAEVGISLKAARMGYRIMEVPVRMEHRRTGRNFQGFYHRGRQFWHISRVFWKQAGRA